MFTNNFIPIENVMVRPEIMETHFSCDLEKCKGACCTVESEYGAPLLDEEIPVINEILEEVYPYLPEEHVKMIKENGFSYKIEGETMTRSMNKKECVFVNYENTVAKCSIEKAYFDGKIKFRKPISCHLFPIRVTKFGGDVLRYEKFNECAPALEKGKKENVKIAEFCKDSLVRAYGNKWYKTLMDNKEK
ncbi:MAG: DUF3109 family protein [Ignavibacteriaceae bacterium]|nr:DUF3109 family protein [Ignavibacteriaceae bacterium]